MKDFKAGSLLALVILALTITAYLKTYNADYVPIEDIKAEQAQVVEVGGSDAGRYADELAVVHVYEDGCIEVMDEVDGDIKFYCEVEFK